MTDDNNIFDKRIIGIRRKEVQDHIDRLKSEIVEYEGELSRLDELAAELNRLSGAKPLSIGETNGKETPKILEAPTKGTPKKITDMIKLVLEEARSNNREGMRPVDIANVIIQRWLPDGNKNNINAQAWSLAKSGEIDKVGKLYYAKENQNLSPNK